MTGKTKFPRAAAIEVARELVTVLKPLCEPERLRVLGSLRRRKEEVGDVEILYVPFFGDEPDPADLFGSLRHYNHADRWLNLALHTGTIARRPRSDGAFTWGEENKFALHIASGIPVDFFSATEANWWNLLVCRTGPAESNTQICMAAERRGWKWDPYSPGFLDRHTGQLVYRTLSERDVFNAVHLSYAEPWER